jgi:probable rRNA maturation factor
VRKFSLVVQFAAQDVTAKNLPRREHFRAWVKAALPEDCRGLVTIRLVSQDEGRQLNLQYRGKDYPTNVLSFPYDLPAKIAGDLAICPAVVESEALEQKKLLAAHYAHMTVHGLLHLQGYNHENVAEAEVMERREREILDRLGFPDPYCLTDPS